MSELTKEEIAAFIKQWKTETADYLIGHQAPYYIPKPWRIQRELREGKRGILDGIEWAQDGRAMADVEIVIKRGPGIPLVDQTGTEEECRRFDEIVAEDEELAAYIDESEQQVGRRIQIDGETYYEISTARWDLLLRNKTAADQAVG
jgi:hypothetical protein